MDIFEKLARAKMIYDMLTGPGGGQLVIEALEETGGGEYLAAHLSHHVIRYGIDEAEGEMYESILRHLNSSIVESDVQSLVESMVEDARDMIFCT